MRFLSPVTRLGMRLLARVLLVFALTGMALTALSGYLAWREVIAAQDKRIAEIRNDIVVPLINDIWNFDTAKISLQLEVISHMLPRAAIRLDTTEGHHLRTGARDLPADAEIHRIELFHPQSQVRIGLLTLAIDPRLARETAFHQALGDMILNLTLLLLLAAALGIYVHSLIVGRLHLLAGFVRAFDPDRADLQTPPPPLLNRTSPRDEIDDLALAFERMRARILDDIRASRVLENELSHQAQHDALTGLGNRNHLALRARTFLQGDCCDPVAFVFIDVDRLKLINDTLGHVVGDRLLCALARRMEAVLPERVELFRPGSDEFLLLIAAPDEAPDVGQIAADLQKIMAVPFLIDHHELRITISIGAAIAPQHGNDQSILMRHADIALQAAKRGGRGNTCIFSPALLASLNERVQIESLLRSALDRGELSVHYQPQIDLASGRLVGAEALLRWNSQELGPVSPDRFIPIAEDCGAIIDIGAWVMRTACREARRWRNAGLELSLAVNLSAVQLRHSALTRNINEALNDSGLPPALLEIEITESVIMEDVEQAAAQLEALRSLGLRIAIDDFGTGYSSLAYLKHLPIDSLKIDRAFITDIPGDSNDTAIAIAVIRLAEALNLSVVAEGVENHEQADLLRSERCHLAQGYLFAKPLPAEQFLDFALAGADLRKKA